MNFDILVRLTSQKSTIIYYDMKDIIKKKKKIYKTPLGQTHDNKRWQIIINQTKQNETEGIDTYYERDILCLLFKVFVMFDNSLVWTCVTNLCRIKYSTQKFLFTL